MTKLVGGLPVGSNFCYIQVWLAGGYTGIFFRVLWGKSGFWKPVEILIHSKKILTLKNNFIS